MEYTCKRANNKPKRCRFFHPDYTVGSGIAPDQHPETPDGRGLYRRWGISPRPETAFLSIIICVPAEKCKCFVNFVLQKLHITFLKAGCVIYYECTRVRQSARDKKFNRTDHCYDRKNHRIYPEHRRRALSAGYQSDCVRCILPDQSACAPQDHALADEPFKQKGKEGPLCAGQGLFPPGTGGGMDHRHLPGLRSASPARRPGRRSDQPDEQAAAGNHDPVSYTHLQIRFRIISAGISITIFRSTANSSACRPMPQAWNTPTARKSMHRKGSARHMPCKKREP